MKTYISTMSSLACVSNVDSAHLPVSAFIRTSTQRSTSDGRQSDVDAQIVKFLTHGLRSFVDQVPVPSSCYSNTSWELCFACCWSNSSWAILMANLWKTKSFNCSCVAGASGAVKACRIRSGYSRESFTVRRLPANLTSDYADLWEGTGFQYMLS